jgi:glucose-6-phosphate 1-dehydrogenase
VAFRLAVVCCEPATSPSSDKRLIVPPQTEDLANELVFEVVEPGAITLNFLAKGPGATALGSARVEFRYEKSFCVDNELEAYERLIHDPMIGDRTLFTSADGIERLWKVATPLLDNPPPVQPYVPGSWGPTRSTS